MLGMDGLWDPEAQDPLPSPSTVPGWGEAFKCPCWTVLSHPLQPAHGALVATLVLDGIPSPS